RAQQGGEGRRSDSPVDVNDQAVVEGDEVLQASAHHEALVEDRLRERRLAVDDGQDGRPGRLDLDVRRARAGGQGVRAVGGEADGDRGVVDAQRDLTWREHAAHARIRG